MPIKLERIPTLDQAGPTHAFKDSCRSLGNFLRNLNQSAKKIQKITTKGAREHNTKNKSYLS